jgi:beta-phosphoglucomutase-like phosphatase (HAD superfamily)
MQAVLFDLDGTLIDSEGLTDSTIREVVARYGPASAELPPYETRGRTWDDIASSLTRRYGLRILADVLSAELLTHWSARFSEVEPLPAAIAALSEVAALVPVAIVSSSPKSIIARALSVLAADAHIPLAHCVGGDEVSRPKPDPQAFLLAAARLQVDPSACVVFEDSEAGLVAARAAGMASVLVRRCCAAPEACEALASAHIEDYRELAGHFAQLTTNFAAWCARTSVR